MHSLKVARAIELRDSLRHRLLDDPAYYLFERMPPGKSKDRHEAWLEQQNPDFQRWNILRALLTGFAD